MLLVRWSRTAAPLILTFPYDSPEIAPATPATSKKRCSSIVIGVIKQDVGPTTHTEEWVSPIQTPPATLTKQIADYPADARPTVRVT